MMTMTQLGPYQGGSYLPWEEVAPLLPPSDESLTNSLSTTGVSWPKSINTMQWTNSASYCAPKSISLSRRSKRLIWNEASAKGGSRQPKQTVKSTICGSDKLGPNKSRTVLGQIWCAKTAKPTMDVGIHSDKGRGVTGLGRV